VAFVGTNRAHKGIDILRSAVANLQTEGYRLIITDDEPDDSKPWEQWTGATSMAEGIRIVASSDVVIIPSINLAYARGQLPAKLMDAMMLGRAIAVTNIEPMPWALGSGGRVILPGSVEAVEEVLVEFRDPLVRKNLGTLARARALALFVASPYIDVFHNAVNDAISQSVPISPS
jgi:glycosyltransferase involved in cell wall biosynthesis